MSDTGTRCPACGRLDPWQLTPCHCIGTQNTYPIVKPAKEGDR